MKNYSKNGFIRLFVKVVFVAIVSIVVMGFETLTAPVNLSHTNNYDWFSYHMRSVDPAGDNMPRNAISNSGNSECLSWVDGPKCTAVPIVTTLDATAITATGATLNGIVNPNAGATNYCFHWGTTTSYGYATLAKSAGSGSSNVVVFSAISGLTPGITYHFKLVATNALGTTIGNDKTFIAGSAELTTTPVTSITSVSALSGGNIISNGGSGITARGVCWSQTPFPTTADPHTTDGSGSGIYTSMITGLGYGTLYHVRAYAINSNGTFYGGDLAFTTLSCGNFSLPFSEDFSSGTLPVCWSQVDNLGTGQIWQFGTITAQSPNPQLSGNYAFVNSNDSGSGSTQNADLLSPVFDFSAYSSILLHFNHFMFSNDGSSGSVWYSINNGSDWTLIQLFAATSTANPDAFNQAVDAVAGHQEVMFKWNYTGMSGSYWAIDDVLITGILTPPTLSVTPSNQEVAPPPGSITFSVISSTNWTTASDQTWCEITPSGTGDGTITAIYTENSSATERLANITVTADGLSPVVVTVTQTAQFISVLQENQDVGYQAGNVVFNVTSNANWTASDNQSWCAVTPSGTGNGTIYAAFEENTLFSPRIAEITITVNGLSPIVVTVSQAAAPLSLTVTPANRDVLPDAGSTSFYITTPQGWSATSDQLWCTVTPSGYGNGTLTATYDQNTTNSARVANIAVAVNGLAPVVVTVTQEGIIESEFLLTIQNITQTAPNVFVFDIYLLDVDASEPLELAGIQEGINFNTGILNGAAQTEGMATIIPFATDLPSYMAPMNTSTSDPGQIKIAGRTPPGPGNGQIVSTVAPGTRIARIRFTNSVPFTENSTPNLQFTSSSAIVPSYATRVAKYQNNVNIQLPVYAGINAIVNGNPVLNGPPNLNVTPGNQTVESANGNYDFTVNSNAAWIAQSDQSWLSVTVSGYGNGAIAATFTENTSEARTANITVIVPGLPDASVTLTQEAQAFRLLNLNFLIEGLYAGNGTLTQARDESGPHFEAGISDMVTVELHNSADYAIVEHSVSNVELNITGDATINIPQALNGSYFITIKHRNSVETTSAYPVLFNIPVVSYAFDSQNKAYGNNLLLTDRHYLVKSGDINQDGSVDIADMTLIENDANGFTTGYVPGDVNGDGVVDTADMTIVDNNSTEFVIAETP